MARSFRLVRPYRSTDQSAQAKANLHEISSWQRPAWGTLPTPTSLPVFRILVIGATFMPNVRDTLPNYLDADNGTITRNPVFPTVSVGRRGAERQLRAVAALAVNAPPRTT